MTDAEVRRQEALARNADYRAGYRDGRAHTRILTGALLRGVIADAMTDDGNVLWDDYARELRAILDLPPLRAPDRALPEPDFWLIGYKVGSPTEQERAEWHDEWHRQHPDHRCDDPDRPRSSYRPGRLERARRWVHWYLNPS
jgi:hypothetical protein